MSSCQDALFSKDEIFRVYEPCLGVRFTADRLDDCIDFLNADLKKRGYTKDQCEATINVYYKDTWHAVKEELWWDKIVGCEQTTPSNIITNARSVVSSFLMRLGDSPTQKK